jgi:predicted aspartyl protease
VPSITLQNSPQGPLVSAYFGLSDQREIALREAGLPEPDLVNGIFLIDTGASLTCVDKVLLEQLQIPPSGTISIATPSTGGKGHTCWAYDVSLFIPNVTKGKRGLHVLMLQVAEIDIAYQGISGLIGRDVLANANFIYNGEAGLFTLAY